LNDLTFGVEQGQIFCMLGPNGAGKSTSFDIIAHKIPRTTGELFYQGEESVHTRLTCGLTTQSNTLWNFMTIRQHLRVYSYMKGLSKNEANESIEYLLEIFNLKDHADKKIDQLSGGTKRKLSVALSVLKVPDVIFLDEPTTGVDPIGRSQIWRLLKMLMKEKPITVILSTHYIEDAELIADKLGIMVNGGFATIGNMVELRKKYENYLIVIDETELKVLDEIKLAVQSVSSKAIMDQNPERKGLVFRVRDYSRNILTYFIGPCSWNEVNKVLPSVGRSEIKREDQRFFDLCNKFGRDFPEISLQASDDKN